MLAEAQGGLGLTLGVGRTGLVRLGSLGLLAREQTTWNAAQCVGVLLVPGIASASIELSLGPDRRLARGAGQAPGHSSNYLPISERVEMEALHIQRELWLDRIPRAAGVLGCGRQSEGSNPAQFSSTILVRVRQLVVVQESLGEIGAYVAEFGGLVDGRARASDPMVSVWSPKEMSVYEDF